MQIFTELDFKIMPWKNGGGVTTELFCLNDPTHSSVLFRLSIARVEYDGPFSNFLGIDRTLLLLKGKGFNLESINSNTVIEFNSAPFNFKGEDSVKCTLIDGPCVDFNVMTARSFAHSKVFVENLSKNSPFFFQS